MPSHEDVIKFIDWTSRKTRMHFSNRQLPDFQEHEIWWAGCGENVGSEMNGKNFLFERPVIIVTKFSNNIMLVVPLTTKPKHGNWYFPLSFEGRELRAILSQIRTISSRRLLRKMGHMDSVRFKELKKAIAAIILTDPPA